MIEQNIPIPVRGARPPRFPARRMSVGDSVFFPLDHPKPTQTLEYQRTAVCARRWTQRTNMRFAVRLVEGGIRVWRTE